MIRVLHICAALDGGGVERFLFNYWQAADKNKLHFDFIVHSEKQGILEKETEQLGSKIYHVVPKSKDLLKYLKDIKRILREGSYDIVHCHQGYNSYIPLAASKLCGIRSGIAHAHTAFEIQSGYSAYVRKLRSFLTKCFASGLAACSSDAGSYMWGSSPFEITENAIDLKAYSFSSSSRSFWREKLGFTSEFVIGCVGRLCPSKNHIRLLNIFSSIQNIYPDCALLIVGTGVQENSIKKAADEMKLRNVCLFGVSSQAHELLSAMDVFVLPTLFEGFGMAFIEAQANGLHTFASLDVVPADTRISGLIHYIPLCAGDDEWAQNILKYYNGHEQFEPLECAVRYDINHASDKLYKFYKESIEK